MPSRLTLALALFSVVLIGALVGATHWALSERDRATTAETQAKALAADNRLLVQRAGAVQGAVQAMKKNREKADAALTDGSAETRAWASAAVPADARAGLCSAIHCKE